MLNPQLVLPLAHDPGIEQAIGRHVDIAVNHDPDAVGMHEVNHPQTRHYLSDVWEVDPLEACDGRRVGLLHASPDCTHHSQAKGGQPREQEIRSLAWVVPKWVGKLMKRGLGPVLITLENVGQMLQWSPLIAKRDRATGRVITLDKVRDPITGKSSYRVADKGEHVPRRRQFLVPDPKHKGRNWRHFVEHLRRLGCQLQWKVIINANLGAHSTRERLYLIARTDGQPIVWPEQSHAKKPTAGQQAWSPAADCIDWSIQGRSIFGRKKSLADATMRRIAHGIHKYVLTAAEPFIVPATHTDTSDRTRCLRDPLPTVTAANRGELMLLAPSLVPVTHTRDTAFDMRQPLRTITTAKGGETAMAAAILVQTGYGEREGQAPRSLDISAPLGTVVAGACKHGLATAFMVQANGGFNETHARDITAPMSTVTTTGSQQQLITAHLATLRKNCNDTGMNVPVSTIAAGSKHHAVVEYHLSQEHEVGALRCAAFLLRYHASGGQWSDLRDPTTTITTRDRLALVTVWLKGEPYVIVDICLRMLTPRELYNAQDFPPTYVIDRTAAGKALTNTAQVRMCGNSVSPLPMQKIVAANYAGQQLMREAA
jgi:DNA (cytosine-5)-methyltransferase 1